jgi:hypothetical protein
LTRFWGTAGVGLALRGEGNLVAAAAPPLRPSAEEWGDGLVAVLKVEVVGEQGEEGGGEGSEDGEERVPCDGGVDSAAGEPVDGVADCESEEGGQDLCGEAGLLHAGSLRLLGWGVKRGWWVRALRSW